MTGPRHRAARRLAMFPSTLPTDDADDESGRPRRRAAAGRAVPPAASADSADSVDAADAGSAGDWPSWQAWREDGDEAGAPTGTDISSLSPSLMQDLMRFERHSEQRELLEVLAACLRHTQSVAVRLAWEAHELTLTVFPLDRLVHCPMPMREFLATDLAALKVLKVLPAALRPPGDAEPARIGRLDFYAPLSPLLWAVALNGARGELLPELAGMAAYRATPSLSLHNLPVPAVMADCIARLRRSTATLRELAEWHGIGRDRASRLLNALYLQSGLIVSRTHPKATSDGW